MRLTDLCESVTNASLLSELADFIISLLPRRVLPGTVESVHLGSYWDETSLEKIKDRYWDEKYREAFSNFNHLKIVLDNKTETTVAGAFLASTSLRGGDIYIYLRALTENPTEGPVNPGAALRTTGSIRSVKSTLVHELRHFFQRFLYQKYYFGRPYGNYRRDPIEIDAAWYHHLEEINPSDYGSAQSYANAVMERFAEYKDLTPYYHRHYHRKAAKYWLDRFVGPNVPHMTPKERSEMRKAAQANAVAEMFDSKVESMRGSVPGYSKDAVSFFIRDDWARVLRQVVKNQSPIGNGNEGIAYLLLALGSLPNKQLAKSVIERLSGKSFEESVSSLSFPADKYDVDAIERFLRDRFSD